MSKRKYVRQLFRVEAERIGVKPSRYVMQKFNKYQIKKYGATVRKINQAKGTHKRKLWKIRIADVI